MNIRLNRGLVLLTVVLLSSCQAMSNTTIRQEMIGDTYLYLGEQYGKSCYKPMYVLDCQTEDQYEDKDMTLNETWFSMRADATYVRSGYYDPSSKTYDYAKITYNVSGTIRPDNEYWGRGTFYLTNVEQIIATTNGEVCRPYGCHIHENKSYEKDGLDFYEVKADFYKQVMSLISRIVSQEPIRKGESN